MHDQDLHAKLIGFLEGKDPQETYMYSLSGCCAAAQFNQSVGLEYPLCEALRDKPGVWDNRKPETFDGKLEYAASKTPGNFGALLERVRDLEDA